MAKISGPTSDELRAFNRGDQSDEGLAVIFVERIFLLVVFSYRLKARGRQVGYKSSYFRKMREEKTRYKR